MKSDEIRLLDNAALKIESAGTASPAMPEFTGISATAQRSLNTVRDYLCHIFKKMLLCLRRNCWLTFPICSEVSPFPEPSRWKWGAI